MSEMQEVVDVWGEYLATLSNWKNLVAGIKPKVGGCGLVYELTNPIDRPGESFAIADMSQLELSEPHKHINGEIEIYFVLQGIGKIAIEGKEVSPLVPGTSIITESGKFHIVLPGKDLVLAVVNTPPFDVNNYEVVGSQEPEVAAAINELHAA